MIYALRCRRTGVIFSERRALSSVLRALNAYAGLPDVDIEVVRRDPDGWVPIGPRIVGPEAVVA